MENKKNDLLLVYLNEFNREYLLKGAKKYNCDSILKILKFKSLKTFTKDKKQDKNLDPWVQSVSIATGKSSKYHKVFKIGQSLNKKHVQLWDKLSNKGITCSVWGAMNSNLRKNKHINYYFPDPWNFTDSTIPKNLIGLFLLPNYYAKNYLNYSFIKFINLSTIFIFTLISYVNLKTFLKDFFYSFTLCLKIGIKNFILFFLFDQIFLNIFDKTTKNKKSSFSIIFLNSIAHFQHNNWDEVKNEKYFFMYVENIFKKILKINESFKSFLIINGFTQKKISTEYILRPKNPKKFLSKFIQFERLEQDMTNGGFIYFKNLKEKNKAIKILNKLFFIKTKIFYIKNYNSNKLFYKINIKSKKLLLNNDFHKHKIVAEKYFFKNLNVKKTSGIKKINIEDFFLKNIKFIKTTGVHTPEGVALYKNFDQFNYKKQIENHKIFNSICKHFQI